MDTAAIQNFPKVDLHCHLDGSMSAEVVAEIANKENINIPSDISELNKILTIDSECKSLNEYLTKFELPISCLKTSYGLETAAYNLIKEAAKENVIYLEVRFAPLFSVGHLMDLSLVIESVLTGLKRAEADFAISSSLILCAMRHQPLEDSIALVDVAAKYKQLGVGGIDLAGNEADFPPELFSELFRYAKSKKVNFTIHAGETGVFQNINTAIELGAKRVGHGISVVNSLQLTKLCSDYGLVFELCPTSNYQTKAVAPDINYPINYFIENELLFTVNTDNRTVSNTTLTKEYVLLQNYTDVSYDLLKNATLTAINAAFADEKTKQRLRDNVMTFNQNKTE